MHCAHMVTFCNGTVMMSSMYTEFQPTIRYTSLSKRLSFYHSIANINMISMNYNRIVYARNPFQSNWLQCVRCLVPAIVKRLIAFPMKMFEIISFGMTNFSKINFVWPFDFWPFDFRLLISDCSISDHSISDRLISDHSIFGHFSGPLR